jgi:hypothetical protein
MSLEGLARQLEEARKREQQRWLSMMKEQHDAIVRAKDDEISSLREEIETLRSWLDHSALPASNPISKRLDSMGLIKLNFDDKPAPEFWRPGEKALLDSIKKEELPEIAMPEPPKPDPPEVTLPEPPKPPAPEALPELAIEPDNAEELPEEADASEEPQLPEEALSAPLSEPESIQEAGEPIFDDLPGPLELKLPESEFLDDVDELPKLAPKAAKPRKPARKAASRKKPARKR